MKSWLIWVNFRLYRVWFDGEHIRYVGKGPYIVNSTKVVVDK